MRGFQGAWNRRDFPDEKIEKPDYIELFALTLIFIGIIASMVYFYSTQMLEGATVTYAKQALIKTIAQKAIRL